MAEELRLPGDQINYHAPFERFGIDSIMVVSVTRRLEKIFGPLSKTLLFEYLSLDELAEYFVTNHKDVLTCLFNEAQANQTSVVASRAPASSEKPVNATAGGDRTANNQIAIIGLAGRYPKAQTLGAFWQNLKNGVDSITEIPASRWNYDDYVAGVTPFGKWAGFIEDPAAFDASFFNISPREAIIMDPQERLLLETVWHLLEDAAYTRAELNRVTNRRVGVFVGVMNGDYRVIRSPTRGTRKRFRAEFLFCISG